MKTNRFIFLGVALLMFTVGLVTAFDEVNHRTKEIVPCVDGNNNEIIEAKTSSGEDIILKCSKDIKNKLMMSVSFICLIIGLIFWILFLIRC